MSRRLCDRRDAKRVRNLDGVHAMMVHLKPLRCDSDVYINHKVDVTELVKYVKEQKKKDPDNKLTYFHAFVIALGKTFYNRPLLNRFVLNRRYYDKETVTVGFVAKVAFEDDAKENMSVVKIEETDNIFKLRDKLNKKVESVRKSKDNSTDDIINVLGKLPVFLARFAVWVLKKLDNHDLLPKSLIENEIYHSSVIISNLGSIRCGAIYHNLTDFGTSSMLLTVGEIRQEQVVMPNGKIEIRDMCEFGVTIDERIADGFYFAKAIKIFEHILLNPDTLERDANEKIKEAESRSS